MKKLYDELWDNILRVYKPGLVFMVLSLITKLIAGYFIGIVNLDPDNPEFYNSFIKIIIDKKIELIVFWVSSFLLSLFVLMGLWGSLMSEKEVSFNDFINYAKSNFKNGFFAYLIINIYWLFFSSFSLLVVKYKNIFFIFIIIYFIFIGLSLWIAVRISLWQPFTLNNKALMPLIKSFKATKGYFFLLFFVLMLPEIVFDKMGNLVSFNLLKYSFFVFNASILPFIVEVMRYMLYKKIAYKEVVNNFEENQNNEN